VVEPGFAANGQSSVATLTVVTVKRRGWFRDEVELTAERDITAEKIEGWGASVPRLEFYRFHMAAGTSIIARIPTRFRGRAHISLKEIGDCDGLRQRWEQMGRF
jgi:hypothetical protein